LLRNKDNGNVADSPVDVVKPEIMKLARSVASRLLVSPQRQHSTAVSFPAIELRPSPLTTKSLLIGNRQHTLLASGVQIPDFAQVRTFLRPSLDAKQIGSITLLEIKKFLRQKSIDFEESHACLKMFIPKHHIPQPDGRPSLDRCQWENVERSLAVFYINKTTGGFVCPELAIYGDWKQLQPFLVSYCRNRAVSRGSEEPAAPLPTLDLAFLESLVAETWNSAVPVESLSGQQFKELLKQFSLSREITPEDFAYHQVRCRRLTDCDRYELYFPVRYPYHDKIIGLKRVAFDPDSKRICEENVPSEKELARHHTHPTSTQSQEDTVYISRVLPFMYGADRWVRTGASKSVVIVSSVLDALTVASKAGAAASGSSGATPASAAVIALAEGATTLPPEHLPFLESFDEIVFWFPNDTPSTDSVSAFGRKLGDKRCKFVSRDFDQPSVYFKRKGVKAFKEVLRSETRPCSHEYITTFDSLRDDVFLELAHAEEVEGVKFKRFDQMNEILRGFRRGELTVFSGRTGSGKTTFMSEYSLDLCQQNVNTLWGSFEVRNVRLAKMQLKQFSGVNLENNLEAFDSWADKFSKLPMYYLTFHGAQEIDKVLDAMGYAVYVFDIAHVVIDNLQFMMGSTNMRSMDRFYVQDVIIQKFRKFATLHNVHMTLVIHPRKEDEDRLTSNSIFGGAKATQEADNVVLLQEEEINAKLKRKYVQVVKNRFSGDLGIVPLFFNRSTVTFSKKIFAKERANAKKASSSAAPSLKPKQPVQPQPHQEEQLES